MMSQANLSSSALEEYLKFMIGKRLIEKRDILSGHKKRKPVYQAAEKGNRFFEL